MPHPNQLALPVAVANWIDQSQHLQDNDAADRLNGKLELVTEAINIIASDVDDLPIEFAGLSIIDLMSASASLAVEIGVRRRFAAMDLQVAA